MAGETVTPRLTPPRVFLARMLVFIVLAGFLALILYRQIAIAFMANPGLNGLILGVLAIGVILSLRQVARLFPEARWINAVASGGAPRAAMRVGLLALALIFAANSVLAIYHSGVEAKLWQGPTACTGGGVAMPASAGDLLSQLDNVKVVRCDAVNLRVFGLSLANWNIFISAALAGLAARATLLKA